MSPPDALDWKILSLDAAAPLAALDGWTRPFPGQGAPVLAEAASEAPARRAWTPSVTRLIEP